MGGSYQLCMVPRGVPARAAELAVSCGMYGCTYIRYVRRGKKEQWNFEIRTSGRSEGSFSGEADMDRGTFLRTLDGTGLPNLLGFVMSTLTLAPTLPPSLASI